MSSLNKIRILENDEQKKTNPNSNEAFELGFVDSLKGRLLDDLYFISFVFAFPSISISVMVVNGIFL